MDYIKLEILWGYITSPILRLWNEYSLGWRACIACGYQSVVGLPADNGGDFLDNGGKYTGTPEYTYDANGNLTKDANKGILSITYNYLNLPVSITKSGGTRVEYSY